MDFAGKKPKPFRAEVVLFDFDGTLTKPGALDFASIKKEIGCPPDKLVLEFINNLASVEQRSAALSVLDRFEAAAAGQSEPNLGAEALLADLRSEGLYLGIISRNSRRSIIRALENFEQANISDFSVIISRDDPAQPKPSGDGIQQAAKQLNVPVENVVVVGDVSLDIMAGQNAGAVTVFLNNGNDTCVPEVDSDYTISCLSELKAVIRLGFVLPAGKFPNDLLEEYLGQLATDDPSVLINPGVGEDTAAVAIDREETLILKSDPITFATDSIAHYAVLINANDIATAGATPRWFLATLLLPHGMTASQVIKILADLQMVCDQWDITLCGGHTEITDAVNRPVVAGMLAGTVARDQLIDKRSMRPGDCVLLSKAAGVEGTAIIAREFGDRLQRLGMTATEVEKCRQLLACISILEEAQIARNSNGVHAMHDVTEGGVATALEELSVAGGHRIRIDVGRIPIYGLTAKICRLLQINPLGLIGSGGLLICCREDDCQQLMTRIQDVGVEVTRIGEVLEPGRGIEAVRNDRETQWPRFAVDEITRLF